MTKNIQSCIIYKKKNRELFINFKHFSEVFCFCKLYVRYDNIIYCYELKNIYLLFLSAIFMIKRFRKKKIIFLNIDM